MTELLRKRSLFFLSFCAFALLVVMGSHTKATKYGCFYYAPGDLIPGTGAPSRGSQLNSRDWGEADGLNPIKGARGVAKSQIFSPGGYYRPGDECAASNFSGPDRDTYCEFRGGKDRLAVGCSSTKVHVAIDINGGSRDDCLLMRNAQERVLKSGADPKITDLVAVQAVQDGTISEVGDFSFDLSTTGRVYRYMHVNMKTLQVKVADTVKKGQVLGYLYDDFCKNEACWTPFHLHWEIRAVLNGEEVFVSPYMAYIRSKERTLNVSCQLVQ